MQNLDKYEDRLSYESLKKECEKIRSQGVPSSLREVYSEIVPNNSVLVSCELYSGDDLKLTLGVNYDKNGKPVDAYTHDEKGNKIALAKSMMNDNHPLLSEELTEQLNTMRTSAQERFNSNVDKKAAEHTATEPTPKRVIKNTKLSVAELSQMKKKAQEK